MLENPTLQLVCEESYCSYGLNFKFICVGGSTQSSSVKFVSCIHLSSSNFAFHLTPQPKNPKELGMEIKTALSR